MVYVRRRRSRTTSRKKRVSGWASYVTPGNAMKAAGMAKAAWAGVQYLKGLVNSERMYYDRALTLGAAQNNIWHLTGLPQGDSQDQRTGNSILLRSIFLRGYIQVNSSVTGHSRVALVLIRDNQQLADTTPTLTDLFQDPTNVDTMINKNTSGRFKILWRKQYTIYPQSAGGSAKDITKYIKTYDHVRYNGTTGSDIQKHGYYLCMLTSETTNFPNINITSRIGYHDN